MKAHHPLWHLFLFRMRGMLREPMALFWIFAFPLLTALSLGLAFRERPLDRLLVAVEDGPRAEILAEQLQGSPDLRVVRLSEAEALESLRKNQVSLVLSSGLSPELFVDSQREEGRTARLAALAALAREPGRVEAIPIREHPGSASGNRYIDFLLPGLIGFGLMSTGLWSVGLSIVQLRAGKLLGRLAATPMRRGHFLLSFLFGRAALALLEILFILALGWVLFDARVSGSLSALLVFGLIGAMSFGGLALLLGSRTPSPEVASGWVNLISLPMIALSGVFFPVSHLPGGLRAIVQFMPLTALNDGLRHIMVDGASLLSLWKNLLVLGIWCLVPFALALRIFRWK